MTDLGEVDHARLEPLDGAPLGRLRTVANLITLVRTLGAVTVGFVALLTEDPLLLGIAYATYWLGDMLDGFVARRMDHETRFGAVFDIVSDRACASILCAGLIAYEPDVAPAILPFFCSFMVLDTMLSLAFLCWPLKSPNYFGQVDRTVYRLNWSPPAKSLNTAAVVLLALVGLVWLSVLLTLVLISVKVWSGVRVLQLLEGR